MMVFRYRKVYHGKKIFSTNEGKLKNKFLKNFDFKNEETRVKERKNEKMRPSDMLNQNFKKSA